MKSELMRRTMLWMMAISAVLGASSRLSAADLRLDHRRYADKDGNNYYVAFVVRDGNPGYAFVVWGVEDSKRRLTTPQGYGYYPSKATAVFGSISNDLRQEAFKARSSFFSQRMIVQVNRDWFDNTKGEIAKWSTNDRRLFATNCIDFLRAVTQRTNTKIPARERTDTPVSHLLKIISKNSR